MLQQLTFPSGTVDYHFRSSFADIDQLLAGRDAVFITNEHIAQLFSKLFTGRKCLVLPPSESSKDMHTIETLAKSLLAAEATRNTVLVGVGGGVVTDITGFLASVYMRGVSFGFVPTTLLGMVDAAVGGKNGVNIGMNKNVAGTIIQPEFILYDASFLDTLPDDEWSNGFAEIIKYACIFDAPLFTELSSHNISFYKNDNPATEKLIERCVQWKNKTVAEDEREQGIRKLLNFGHTAAHAIENLYEIPHGKAVAIGMVIACMISEQVTGLDSKVSQHLRQLLSLYHLPVKMKIDAKRAMDLLRRDKKRKGDKIDYILLQQTGQAVTRSLPFDIIEIALTEYDSHH